MARLFDDSLSEYLYRTPSPVTAPPFSISILARTDDVNLQEAMVSIANPNLEYERHMLWLANDVGDPIRASTHTSGNPAEAYTTSGVSANTWFHALGIWISNSSRRVYLNGGSFGYDSTEVIPDLSSSKLGIGYICDSTPSNYWSGIMAEIAIWNVNLTGADAVTLAAGYSPLFVKPQNIVGYWPLIDNLKDIIGGYDLTANGTSITAHPSIIYPTGLLVNGSLAASKKGLVVV